MAFELTAALVVALVVGAWHLVRRRTRRRSGPLPDVPEAPPSAQPIGTLHRGDHGVGAYSLRVPNRADGMTTADPRSTDGRYVPDS